MRLLLIPILMAAPLAAPASPPVDDVDALVALALDQHPAVEAASAEAEAAAARVRQAGSLPDPMLGWGEMLESVETRLGPQQRVLSLQQSLPWPGTLGARGSAARAREHAAGAAIEDARVAVAAGVYRAWAGAAWLAEMQQLLRRQAILVASLEQSLRASFESGDGAYADLLRVQLEQARLDDRQRGLADQAPAALARLDAALGLEAGMSGALPSVLPDAPALPSGARDQRHPALDALGHRARAAELDAEAAGRAGRPQLTLGVDWIQIGEPAADMADGGKDALVARVGVSLPLWRGKHDGARQAADAAATGLAAQHQARRLGLEARTIAAEVNLEDAVRRARLHRDDLLPRARQAYEATLAAYQAGRGSLSDALGAERTLLDLEESLLAARRDAWLASADYHEAAGVLPVTTPSMPNQEP